MYTTGYPQIDSMHLKYGNVNFTIACVPISSDGGMRVNYLTEMLKSKYASFTIVPVYWGKIVFLNIHYTHIHKTKNLSTVIEFFGGEKFGLTLFFQVSLISREP